MNLRSQIRQLAASKAMPSVSEPSDEEKRKNLEKKKAAVKKRVAERRGA